MSRWAVTMKLTCEDDGKEAREEVISVHNMEGESPPDIEIFRGSAGAKSRKEHIDKYDIVRVSHGVQVGMVRGGQFGQVDDFGWKEASDDPNPLAQPKPRGGREKTMSDTGTPRRVVAPKPRVHG